MKPYPKEYSPTSTRARYGVRVCNFICEKVEDGFTLDEICREYKDYVPTRRTILNWQKKYPDFKQRMDFAYFCWIQTKIDRLDYVSKAPLSELYPDLVHDHRAAAEARRAEMDSLKFITGKLASLLSSKFDRAQTIKHEGLPKETGPRIVIANYSVNSIKDIEQNKGKVIDHE